MFLPKKSLFALATVLLSSAIGLLLAEALVRLFVPSPLWTFRDSRADWTPDARLGWAQKGGLDVTTRVEQGWTVRFTSNFDGISPASARREKTPGVFRILLFGDSTALGRNVPQDTTVTAQLQARLAARGLEVEAFNAGVEGYSTDQELILMERLIPLYSPDLVLLVVCDNDLGGNLEGEAYGLPKPRFELEGTLREIPPAWRWRGEEASGLRAWIQHVALYRLAHPWVLGLRARWGGWGRRNLLGLAPEIYYRPDELDHADWRLFEAMLSRMQELARGSGARFAFYAHPAIAEVWDPFIEQTRLRLSLGPSQYDRYALESRYRRLARAAGIDFVALIDRFRENARRGPFHLLPRDPHCNPVGYLVTAEGLAEYVLGSLGSKAVNRGGG